MALFQSAEKKEMQRRLLIKQTSKNIERYIAGLDKQYRQYTEIAKVAKMKGIEQQFKLAVSAIRAVMGQKQKAEEMLLNIQITSQMRDLTKMTKNFLTSMNTMSKDMIKTTKGMDFENITRNFQKALTNVEMATEKLDIMLDNSNDSYEEMANSATTISDESIKKMIDLEIAHQNSQLQAELDEKVNDLKSNN